MAMDMDRKLLFGALALQNGLIDSRQFSESCLAWGAEPGKSLQQVLVERAWISPADTPHLEYLQQRALERHQGNARAVLSDLPSVIRQCLAALRDLDAEGTVAGAPIEPEVDVSCISMDTPVVEARYDLLKVHAAGGIGRVWLARDRHLDREVALKNLRTESAGNSKRVARFLREARLTAQLEHPGIVPVYELVSDSETTSPFYTMRYVRGRTLSSAINDYHTSRAAGDADPLEFASLLTTFAAVCNTLAYAHSRGVLHRDLKGDHVILGDFGEVIVLDWGLAKLVGHPEEGVDPFHVETEVEQDPTLTAQGEVMGTPAYMAPEQAEGRLDQIDHRTDIYGLGAMLYTILTGMPPFPGANTKDVLKKVVRGNPKPPRELWPEVPAALEEACLKAMSKEPQQRYASASDLAQEVQHWQDVQRRQALDALYASEEKYRSLADLIPGIVWTARPDGWIDYANQFWLKFTGLTMQQTEGTGWVATVHPDDLERVTQVWSHALQSGELVEVEYRIKRAADGVYRWFFAQGRPVRDSEGRIVKWFGLLTEIEEQKQGQNALQRENSLGRLLHQVTVAAYEAETFEQAIQVVIDQVCAYTGWPVGHAYLLADQSQSDFQELVPSKIWHLEHPESFESFVRVTEATPLAAGEGLPGRVLASKQPAWVMDVTQDANFPRAKVCANLGVKGAFGFPVVAAVGVIAVLEFFTSDPREPDEVLLRAMSQIGVQLGLVFERKRTEVELQHPKSRGTNNPD